MLRVLAVDLGATSARVAAVDLDARPVAVEIVHRCSHRPLRVSGDGKLRVEPASQLTDDERTYICEHVPTILAALALEPVP